MVGVFYLRRLHFYHTCIDEVPSTFFRELSRNRSIKNLRILFNLLEEYIKLQMLCTFFANNHSLADIQVEICDIWGWRCSSACASCKELHQISRTLQAFNTAKSDWECGRNHYSIDGAPTAETTRFGMDEYNIGRNECAPLATLLHNTEKLRTLNLINSTIGNSFT